MAIWRKVIVSGSSAQLASLQLDNTLNGIVTGSANGTLGVTTVNGTGSVVLTTNATGLVHSGSFSGSFTGPHTGTSSFANNATSASHAVTSSLPLQGIITASVSVSTITFTKGDNSTFAITVSQSGSAASANSVIVNNSTTGIYYPTFAQYSGSATSQSIYVNSGSLQYNANTNTLTVTASVATSSISASYAQNWSGSITNALSASYAQNWSGSITNVLSSSYALTASFALNVPSIPTGSFATTGSNNFIGTENITGSLNVSGSGVTITGSLSVLGIITATGVTSSLFGTASWAVSASQAVSSAFAATAASANSLANALTFGTGLSGSAATYNGSAAVSVAISGSATLTTGNHPKWTGTGFTNSLISDNGTTVTIASGSTISAGGLTVTGNSTFNNNLTVQGDLAVNGTTTFINTTNTYIKDQFLNVYSGSNALGDGGIMVQYSTGSGGVSTGSALYLEAGSALDTGLYGRWAVAFGVAGNATAVTADEYVVTAKINQASAPLNTAPPTWGTGSNGMGNMWVTNAGDIYIWA